MSCLLPILGCVDRIRCADRNGASRRPIRPLWPRCAVERSPNTSFGVQQHTGSASHGAPPWRVDLNSLPGAQGGQTSMSWLNVQALSAFIRWKRAARLCRPSRPTQSVFGTPVGGPHLPRTLPLPFAFWNRGTNRSIWNLISLRPIAKRFFWCRKCP